MKERVLITGGAAGIGAAIAQRCLEDGFDPVVIDRAGASIRANLTDRNETADAVRRALAGGAITRLVNNVGIVAPASASDQTLEEFDTVIELNLRCAFQCMQALLPGMKAAGFGRIVNMSSRAALGKAQRTAYAASKAGLIGMSRVWSLELGQDGITTNAIAPGPIATELFDKANPAGAPATARIIEQIPVKRMGEPFDVANAVSFFLDERSGFVTGQVLYVCGGSSVGGVAT
jgi:3-oxoacyl-[acyl-carrier protein] reductase